MAEPAISADELAYADLVHEGRNVLGLPATEALAYADAMMDTSVGRRMVLAYRLAETRAELKAALLASGPLGWVVRKLTRAQG